MGYKGPRKTILVVDDIAENRAGAEMQRVTTSPSGSIEPRASPGPWTRRIVLTFLAAGLAALALGGVFALATGRS